MNPAMDDTSSGSVNASLASQAFLAARQNVDFREHQYATLSTPQHHMHAVHYVYMNHPAQQLAGFTCGPEQPHVLRPTNSSATVSGQHMVSILQPQYNVHSTSAQSSNSIDYHCDASNGSTDSGLDLDPPSTGRPHTMHITSSSRHHRESPRPCTPPRDSVVEVAQIDNPGDGYFSRENVRTGLKPHVHRSMSSARLNHARRMAQSRGLESTPPGQTVPYLHRERTPSPTPVPVLDFREESSSPNPELGTPAVSPSPQQLSITNNTAFTSMQSTQVTSTPISSRNAPQKIVVHFSGSQRQKSVSLPSSISGLSDTPSDADRLSSGSPMHYSPSPIPRHGTPGPDGSITPASMMAAIKLENSPGMFKTM